MQSLVLRVRDCVCVCVNTVVRVRGASVFVVQPIPADMRLRISIGMPNKKPAAGPRHAQPLDRNRSHACIPTYLSLRIASSERPTCKLPACVRRGISQHPAPAATHHQAHHAGYLPGTLNLLIHESSPKFTGSKRATPATMKMATTAATARTESASFSAEPGHPRSLAGCPVPCGFFDECDRTDIFLLDARVCYSDRLSLF